MSPDFKQLIVGNWEILSTTQQGIDITKNITHFSSDGFITISTPDVDDFVYPGRYRVEGDKLIFTSSKREWACRLSLNEDNDLIIVDHRGHVSVNRKLSKIDPNWHAFIDADGKLKRRKAPVTNPSTENPVKED